MRKIALLLATTAMLATAAYADRTITLMANTSPPYADRQLPEQGLALELVSHILARAGYESDISIEPWSRAMEGVAVGVFDALATAWHSPEREQDFLFSEPYLESRLLVVTLQSNRGNYRRLEDLSGGRLGVRADYAYDIDFAAIPNLRLVEENHLIQNLLNLLNGQVDFVIGDSRTMNYQLAEFLPGERGKLRVLPLDLPNRARHLAASRNVKGHEELVRSFNRALDASRRDGSLAAIIKRWDERYGTLE